MEREVVYLQRETVVAFICNSDRASARYAGSNLFPELRVYRDRALREQGPAGAEM